MDEMGDNARTDLRGRAERIIGLEQTHKGLKTQAKKVKEQIDAAYKDAGGNGYSARTLKQVIRELTMDAADRQGVLAFETEVGLYREAMGILPDGTLGPDAVVVPDADGDSNIVIGHFGREA